MKQDKATQPDNLPKLKDAKSCTTTTYPSIESMIMEIRGQQVMIDRDLAMLYDVETKALNQAVKRNIERFPSNFRFQLSEEERTKLVTDCDRFETLKHSSSLPFVFTEQGVAMLSAILRGQTAVHVSIQIMEAFVAMRHFLSSNASLFQRVETLEQNQLFLFNHQSENDRRLDEVPRTVPLPHTVAVALCGVIRMACLRHARGKRATQIRDAAAPAKAIILRKTRPAI